MLEQASDFDKSERKHSLEIEAVRSAASNDIKRLEELLAAERVRSSEETARNKEIHERNLIQLKQRNASLEASLLSLANDIPSQAAFQNTEE